MDLITEIAARFAEEKGIFRLLVSVWEFSSGVQLSSYLNIEKNHCK